MALSFGSVIYFPYLCIVTLKQYIMQVLIIHDSETEEEVGMVTPLGKVDFDKFDDEVRKTWKKFNDEELAEDYTIEDFVDYHNENSKMQIDWVVSDFIQL